MKAIAENLPSPYEQDIVWKMDASGALFDHLEALKHDGWDRVARAAIAAMRQPPETFGQRLAERYEDGIAGWAMDDVGEEIASILVDEALKGV